MNQRSFFWPMPICTVLLGFLLASIPYRVESGQEDLMPGDEFEVLGEVYAYGVTDELRTKTANLIAIIPMRLRGSEFVSRQILPAGSHFRILAKVPRRWLNFLYVERYFVQTDVVINPAGLPIVLDLSRGNEGVSTVLNPDLYRPVRTTARP